MSESPFRRWTRRLLIVAGCLALMQAADGIAVFGPVSALADPGAGGSGGEGDGNQIDFSRGNVNKKAPAALPPKKVTTKKTGAKTLVVKKPSQAQINAELARRMGGDTIEAIFVLGRVIKAIPGEIEGLKGKIAELEAMIAAGASDEARADLTSEIDRAKAEIERFREAVPLVNAELQTLLNELPHVYEAVMPSFNSVGRILRDAENEARIVSEDLETVEWVDETEEVDEEVAVEEAPAEGANK